MTASTLTARPARTSEVDTVSALCLAAFADEAVTAWVLADPDAPLAAMRETFTASLVAAVEAEALVVAVTAADDAVGASIWLDSDGTSPDNLMPAGDARTSGRTAMVRSLTSARHPGCRTSTCRPWLPGPSAEGSARARRCCATGSTGRTG